MFNLVPKQFRFLSTYYSADKICTFVFWAMWVWILVLADAFKGPFTILYLSMQMRSHQNKFQIKRSLIGIGALPVLVSADA